MAEVREPIKSEKKVFDTLNEVANISTVGIFFWHGLGDCIQFQHILQSLQDYFPQIKFDMLLQDGLGQEGLFSRTRLVNGSVVLEELDYDYVFKIHFPVEQDPNLTKMELCNKMEIGLPNYVGEYHKIKHLPLSSSSRLIGVHFFNTAMPSVFNVSKDVAKKIWNEIVEAGFIPIELHFQHPFHNPVNEKYDFVSRHVRDCKVTTENLFSLIDSCVGIVAVPSGPLHYALATRPESVCYLERSIPIDRFTHDVVYSINVDNYEDCQIIPWLDIISTRD